MEFTETGLEVYKRTYSRVKSDGEREVWPETVDRVIKGNLALNDRHLLSDESEQLRAMMEQFALIPAGRHLWASGVKGRQYLFNCWVAPWSEDITYHFSFTFLRLMEGGGVGANYSNKYLDQYGEVLGTHRVHVVCDPEHPDFEKMKKAGVLSEEYDHEWSGSFEVEDSREGWADALTDLISTYYRDADHENRVFDVSRVRGEGARLKTFGGRASGPLPLAKMLREVSDILNAAYDEAYLDGLSAMEIDHAIAKCVVSGGNRRSARMAIMHWQDPQIEDFIQIKKLTGEHWTTNISVEVDDEFFDAVDSGFDDLAEEVLNWIAEGMLTNGEPGFWNSSYANMGEPNTVISTNPCGEIALEPGENCNLGHINLAAFVNRDGSVDRRGLAQAHRLMTRFLIRATYGDVNDANTRELLARNRRIGVGHLGVASYLALTGTRYSNAPGSEFEDLLRWLANVVDEEARRYAHQLRIPVPVKTRTVAPTGTIAKMPGVSEGIHPIFAKHFIRRIRFSDVDPDQRATVLDFQMRGYKVEADQWADETTVVEIPTKDTLMAQVEERFGTEQAEYIVQAADDLSLRQMLAFQAMYQDVWADNAVSYTVNIDAGAYEASQVADALLQWGPALKGATLFPEMSLPQSPYERITKMDFEFYEQLRTVQVADGVDENCVSGACPVR